MNKKTNVLLWVIQGLLAALVLFAGSMKFIMPVAAMQQGPIKFSGTFLRFIGICEILGGLGLILPGVTKIRTGLTPLAASGLVIIMIGATVTTIITGPVGGAVVPLVAGVLAAGVVYGRFPQAVNA